MRSKKGILILAGLVVLVLVVAGALRGREAEASYRTVQVTRGSVEEAVSSTGTLQATETVEVGTQVSGLIAEILVDFNDRVTTGQLMARIDPTLLRNEVRSAEASVARASAELEQAERDLARNEALHEQQVITDSELDAARYQKAVASASFASASVNLERARRNLEYTEIRAPIDGLVVERSVDVGQTVAASMSAPTLFVLARDLSEMEILAYVDESDIGRIQNGQEVRFTVQAYGDREFLGQVRQVRLQSTNTENVVSYAVVINVPNTGGVLLPGMTATVNFLVDSATDVLRVPNTALRFQPPADVLEALRAERQQQGGAAPLGGTGDGPSTAVAGQRAPGGFGGFSGQRRPAGGGGIPSNRGVLWTLAADGTLRPVRVTTGLTDGQYTVVEGEGLEEGMEVVAGVTSSASGAASNNPFQQPQGGFGGPGGGPRF